MRIVVCVKWVPALGSLRFDPETRRLVREGVPGEVSSFDLRALGAAVALRAAHGGEVAALSMGPPGAREGLLECLALGADRALHLLDPLLAGSDTLATATELTLALAGLPQARRQGGFRFPDAGAAARATAELIRFGVDVAAVEFLDARTVAALNRFGQFGLAETPTLLVEVHGSEAGVAEVWAAAEEVLRGAGGEPLVLPGGRDAWSIREHATRSIAALRPDAATVRADLAIPIGALPRLVARCEAVAAERGLAVHLFGHAGIGILHALVLADAAERAAADAGRDVLVEEALALGGSCSGEHGMGLGNRRYAAREHGAALALMRGVKQLFDPHGILNPGKMW
ncbi:MAG: hypothetical protein E6J60_12135 [Deltaproteobacteria bacterium]|nr:MAG: hypothetical protein E6J60_12135 [Deltaproteobacteria bacterium]